MDNRVHHRKKWRAFSLLRIGFLLLFSAIPAQGAQAERVRPPAITAAQPQNQRPAVMSMRLDGGWITATISDCPLQDVLRELAARTGIIFEVRTQENPLVSVKLSRVSVQEAIQRIATGGNTVFLYGNKGNDPEAITMVRIFPRVETPQPGVLYLGNGAITKIDEIVDTPDQAVKALAESSSVETKERAVEVLVRAKGSKAAKALAGSVTDPAPGIRIAAIDGLAALNARSELPSILTCFKDPNPAVRQSAVTAVGLLGGAKNIKDLQPLLADRDAGVATAAGLAQRRLSAPVKK